MKTPIQTIWGLTGTVSQVHVTVEAAPAITDLPSVPGSDIDLVRMAQWAMNYLVQTPRKELGYEPVFQCYPLCCPPVPHGRDVVVPCDTDTRMNCEWYYMREISGSDIGRDIEAAFHRRILNYVQEDGTVLAHVGCYNESAVDTVYHDEDRVFHVWGATKILHALAEDYRRTGNEASKAAARKIMLRLKKLAVYPRRDCCYFPGGMGAVRQDGTPIPNPWNKHPAPVVEPLVNYYLATGDQEALDFAQAYAEGILSGAMPGGLQIGNDGDFSDGHSHATLHMLWGVAHLGLVLGVPRYLEFVKRCWDWLLSRGTGTGWFPAAPAVTDCNETCCISDMMSIAALLGRGGHPEYFDCVERYMRNYISPLQFIVTPEFEAYYRELNAAAEPEQLRQGLEELNKFQGGFIGGSGLNDVENDLLGGTSGFAMFGCCAPEGMRAIYTTWTNIIDRLDASKLGPAGVYVNLCFSRPSKWGDVISGFPAAGRLTVKAAVNDDFFLRPPHWAPRESVGAFVGTATVQPQWSGAYVRFGNVCPGDDLTITFPLVGFTHEVGRLWKNTPDDNVHFTHDTSGLWKMAPSAKMRFQWLGNMVVAASPPATHTSLFPGHPRLLPPPPP